MKYLEALNMIQGDKKEGYLIHFEVIENGLLKSDYFPDFRNGEEPISSESEAWKIARQFANSTNSNYVNIYVMNTNFRPACNDWQAVFKKHWSNKYYI